MAGDQEGTAYQANLAIGQQYVRERQFIKASESLKKAYEINPSEKLKNFLNRVERAADRARLREERLEKERAEKKSS